MSTCSLRLFQVRQPMHLCTTLQMSANSSSYSGLFHQPHVCTQAHKHVLNSPVFAFLSITAFIQPQIFTLRGPLALLSLMTSKVLFLRFGLFYVVCFIVLLPSLSFSHSLYVVLGEKLSDLVLCPQIPHPEPDKLCMEEELEEVPSSSIHKLWRQYRFPFTPWP